MRGEWRRNYVSSSSFIEILIGLKGLARLTPRSCLRWICLLRVGFSTTTAARRLSSDSCLLMLSRFPRRNARQQKCPPPVLPVVVRRIPLAKIQVSNWVPRLCLPDSTASLRACSMAPRGLLSDLWLVLVSVIKPHSPLAPNSRQLMFSRGRIMSHFGIRGMFLEVPHYDRALLV